MKTTIRTLASLALTAAATTALAGTPRVNSVYPSVAQRGTEIEVTFSGSNLKDARDVLWNTPGFTTTAVSAEGGKFTAKLKIAPDAPLGENVFRVVTASGLADTRLFYVTPFPCVAERAVDPKNPADEQNAQPVALGTTVYGRTAADDQDHYEVELKKGQRLTAEIVGFQLQTQNIYDPYLIVTKADGTVLAEVDDTALGRANPVHTLVAPEDGKYRVTIKDSTNSGPGECHYIMHLGSYLRPMIAYPAGGKAGEEIKVKLIGDAAGVVEKTVKLPTDTSKPFSYFAEENTPLPTTLRVTPFGNVLEAEPNNDMKTATRHTGELPIAFNGILEQAGDADYFRFTAKKGAAYDINVHGRALRSPIDSVVEIFKAEANHIAGNDDAGNLDSYQRWTAPEDGEFCIMVRDKLDRGGPLFAYRAEVKPVVAKLTTWLPEMTINSSQDRRAIVVPKGNRYATLLRVKRSDVGGDATISPEALPAGVTAALPTMHNSVDTVPVVFEAAPDAAVTNARIGMKATLNDPANASVPSEVSHYVEVSENGNRRAFYGVTEDRLPLAVVDEVPVKIELTQPKVPILQNGQMQLQIKATRKNDYKGPINLALLYAPPGISSAGTQPIPEGKDEGQVTISATASAALQKWKICVVGSVDFGSGPTWISTGLVELEVAAPFLSGQLVRTFVDQNDNTTMTLKLTPTAEFSGKAKITLLGLPNEVTAEPVEITKDDKEAKFTIKAGPGSPAGSHRNLFCQFLLTRDGESMTNSFAGGGILRVDKARVAQAEPKK